MKIKLIPFDKLPYSDTCWSLIEGPDAKVYVAACCEHSSGGAVYVLRYDPRTEELVYLLDVAEVVGEPATTGRASQCKIHYSMVIDDCGIMYGATHLSTPAVAEVKYHPFGSFDDPIRSFSGSKLFAFDTASEEVLFTDTIIPWEGCRCMALDQRRRRLYAVGYPRDHFYCYEIDARRSRDLGRLGSVNPQALWIDNEGRVYTTEDYGRIVVYDPDTDALVTSDRSLPHAPYQDGFHNVAYDVVQVPGADETVGVTWQTDPYFFRFSPVKQGRPHTVESLGPAFPGRTGFEPSNVNLDHVGGLVFGADGRLFYSAQVRPMQASEELFCELRVMDVETGERQAVGLLEDQATAERVSYIGRAVRIGPQHLVLGVVMRRPTGIVHVVLDQQWTSGPFQETPRRRWG